MNSRIRRSRCACGLAIALVSLGMGASVVHGQSEEYRHYLEVPVVSGGSLHEVRALLREGNREMRRIVLFGDSQETSPGGAGKAYIPRLQRRLASRFQHVGETPFYGTSPQGSGSPPAGWLMAINLSSQGPLTSTINSDRVPPGLLVKGNVLPSKGGPQQNGGYFCLVHDGSLTGDTVSVQSVLMNPEHRIRAEILVFETDAQAGATYLLRPTNNPTMWSSSIGSGTFELEPIPGCPGLLIGRSQELSRADRNYHRVEILGNDPVEPIEIAGVRFVDMDTHNGVLVQAFCRGGYTSSDVLSNHKESGELIRAVSPHLAILQYGANDMTEVSADGFEQRIREIVAFIRESMNDPCFPIVLIGEPYRWLPAEYRYRQDEYPAAMEHVAMSESGVVAINLRRLLEERYGWNEDYSPHLSDLVHLTPPAQAAVADIVADVLLPAVNASCPGDFNNDGFVDSGDLGVLLLHLDGSDAEPSACPNPFDFDNDGLVNSLDIGWFLAVIGRCPLEYSIEGEGIGGAN